jgi:hypothetical protein
MSAARALDDFSVPDLLAVGLIALRGGRVVRHLTGNPDLIHDAAALTPELFDSPQQAVLDDVARRLPGGPGCGLTNAMIVGEDCTFLFQRLHGNRDLLVVTAHEVTQSLGILVAQTREVVAALEEAP